MDKPTVALALGMVALIGLNAFQGVRISGLEGRLAVVESRDLSALEARPRRGAMPMARRHPGGPGPGPLMRDEAPAATPSGSSGSAEVVEVSSELVETVKQELRAEEHTRRERGREMWMARMREEIDAFAAEEGLSDTQLEQTQLQADQYMQTGHDLRMAIFEGDLTADEGRDEMDAMRTEHEARMVEILGEESYARLQDRFSGGGRRRRGF